jgi:hypothetical protein
LKQPASPAKREVLKRLHLGMWLDGAAEPAFDLAVWDEGKTPFNIADLEGCKAWIGEMGMFTLSTFVHSHQQRAFANAPMLITFPMLYGANKDIWRSALINFTARSP